MADESTTRPSGFLTILLREEAVGGAFLALAATLAVVWASLSPSSYSSFIHHSFRIPPVPSGVVHDVASLVSNFGMLVFFAAIGLEVARERADGALQERSNSILPVGAALGGMIGAAFVFLLLCAFFPSSHATNGWGIPMATDVAFTLGVLSLLGKRLPISLRVFLLALAVADDVASVIVLALTSHEPSGHSTSALILFAACALLVVGTTLALRRHSQKVRWYLLLGLILWWLLAQLGIEPTLAGVIVGILVPTGALATRPGVRLEKWVVPLSTFLVLPLFALVATGVDLGARPWSSNAHVIVPILGARLIGKAGGILLACALMLRFRIGRLPEAVNWSHLVGASILCGIGFTVPLLFAQNAFHGSPSLLAGTKLALLFASILCAVIGGSWLFMTARRKVQTGTSETQEM